MKRLLTTALLLTSVVLAKENMAIKNLEIQKLIKDKKYQQAFKELKSIADKNDIAKMELLDYNVQCVSYYANLQDQLLGIMSGNNNAKLCETLSHIYPNKKGDTFGVSGMYNSSLEYVKEFKASSNKAKKQFAYFESGNLLSISSINYLVMNEIKVDYKSAITDYKKALDINVIKDISSKSAIRLAYLYANGLGTLQDSSTAEKYYNIAIKNGNILAKCALGELYIKEKKISKAKDILKEGYNQGAKLCGEVWKQNNLGM